MIGSKYFLLVILVLSVLSKTMVAQQSDASIGSVTELKGKVLIKFDDINQEILSKIISFDSHNTKISFSENSEMQINRKLL